MTHTTTRVQDNDGHWYWIPNEKFIQFNKDLEAITGIEYMDNPDEFDEFNAKYDIYATGGAPDIMPDVFVQKGLEPDKDESGNEFPTPSSSETSIRSFDSLKKIVEQLEGCGYDCEAGSLVNNTAFLSLKRMAELGGTILNVIPKEGSTYFKDPQEILDLYFQRGIIIADEHKIDLEWKYTANGDIPVPEPNKRYSQVPCLVVRKGNNFSEILYHNDKEQNWDGADRDDYECDFLDVEKWVSLNELENFLNK